MDKKTNERTDGHTLTLTVDYTDRLTQFPFIKEINGNLETKITCSIFRKLGELNSVCNQVAFNLCMVNSMLSSHYLAL